MTEYKRGKPFDVGDEIRGREILGVIDLNLGLEATKYLVRYLSCGHETTVKHASIRDTFLRRHATAACTECARTKAVAQSNRTRQLKEEHGVDSLDCWAKKLWYNSLPQEANHGR